MRTLLPALFLAFLATPSAAQTTLRMSVAESLPVSGYKTMGTALNGGLTTSVTNTVAGPTSGVQCTRTAGGTALSWISPPLAAPVTIAGTVTLNTWAKEAATANNAGMQVTVHQYTTTEQSAFLNTERGTELTTSVSNQNWTATPTSTAFATGDRIVVKWWINDAGGTIASGGSVTMDYNGPTAGADGETYVRFSENITFETADVAFVQVVAKDAGAASSTTQAFSLTSASGDTIIVGVHWDPQSVNVSSVTDSQGNTYVSAVGPTNWDSGGSRQQEFYATNITGGNITITVTMSGTTGIDLEIYQLEYAGLEANVGFDVGSAGTTTNPTTAMDSGSATTHNKVELIYGHGTAHNAVSSAGAGFTTRSTFASNLVEDKYVTARGSYNATATGDGSNTCMHMAAFSAARQPRRVVVIGEPSPQPARVTTAIASLLGSSAAAP